MSSNIKRAREILAAALARASTQEEWQSAVTEAISLMKRDLPEFKARARYPRLDEAQAIRARRLRQQGWGVLQIAFELQTNQGRVTEALKSAPNFILTP